VLLKSFISRDLLLLKKGISLSRVSPINTRFIFDVSSLPGSLAGLIGCSPGRAVFKNRAYIDCGIESLRGRRRSSYFWEI